MPVRVREHGFSTTGQSKSKWLAPLDQDDITRTTRSFLAKMQEHATRNAETYANARVARNQPPEPRYILSKYGFERPANPFNQSFQYLYLPPRQGAYVVTPKGRIRPWNMVVLHQYGEAIDEKVLKTNRNVLSIATDEYGHNPERFMVGVRELTTRDAADARKVSVHFIISRRGDVVASVDINDVGYHSGGDVKPPGLSLNTASIGFELESHLVRATPGGPIFRQPFSVPQLQATAIVLRKLDPFISVPRVYLQTIAQLRGAAKTGGYVRHAVINTPGRRIDAAAQFHIPPGQTAFAGSTWWNTGTGSMTDGPFAGTGPTNLATPGADMSDPTRMFVRGPQQSGWDQLWGYMDQIPGYNLATEVFETPATGLDLQLAESAAAISKAANRGQRIAVQAARDELNAMRRSEQMQQQDRRTLYQNSLTTNQSFSKALSDSITTVNATVDRYNPASVRGVSGATTFDEATGLWSDGEA